MGARFNLRSSSASESAGVGLQRSESGRSAIDAMRSKPAVSRCSIPDCRDQRFDQTAVKWPRWRWADIRSTGALRATRSVIERACRTLRWRAFSPGSHHVVVASNEGLVAQSAYWPAKRSRSSHHLTSAPGPPAATIRCRCLVPTHSLHRAMDPHRVRGPAGAITELSRRASPPVQVLMTSPDHLTSVSDTVA